MGAEAAHCMGLDCRLRIAKCGLISENGVPFGEASLTLLFHDNDVRCSVGEVFSFQRKSIVGVIRKGRPKGWWKIAVFRARDRLTTRTMVQLGCKITRGVASHFARVPAFEGFCVSSEGVGVDALFE